jgi:hypothetical protein
VVDESDFRHRTRLGFDGVELTGTVSHLILDFWIRSHADDRKTPLKQPPIGRDADSLLSLFAVLADSTFNESLRRPTFSWRVF